MRTTGNRCDLYDRIDRLDEARTVADLVARIQPILSELAYYAINGEGAIMEAREEWHAEYTERLHSAADTDRAEEARAPPKKNPKAAGRGGGDPKPYAPIRRGRPDEIPASLAAIMNGTHPSFKEDDG